MNAMSSVDTRNVARDSLFLFAELAKDGQGEKVRVKVRNLSAGGMMADGGGLSVSRGDRMVVELKNIGKVKGNVAWVQGNRFGIAFDDRIDASLARAPVGSAAEAPRHVYSAPRAGAFDENEKRIRRL